MTILTTRYRKVAQLRKRSPGLLFITVVSRGRVEPVLPRDCGKMLEAKRIVDDFLKEPPTRERKLP
jgi:hypothetical protein